MMKRLTAMMMAAVITAAAVTGCGSSQSSSGTADAAPQAETAEEAAEPGDEADPGTEPGAEAESGAEADAAAGDGAQTLADGMYTADFNTDGSMFHVNETKDGKGILTSSAALQRTHRRRAQSFCSPCRKK